MHQQKIVKERLKPTKKITSILQSIVWLKDIRQMEKNHKNTKQWADNLTAMRVPMTSMVLTEKTWKIKQKIIAKQAAKLQM